MSLESQLTDIEPVRPRGRPKGSKNKPKPEKAGGEGRPASRPRVDRRVGRLRLVETFESDAALRARVERFAEVSGLGRSAAARELTTRGLDTWERAYFAEASGGAACASGRPQRAQSICARLLRWLQRSKGA